MGSNDEHLHAQISTCRPHLKAALDAAVESVGQRAAGLSNAFALAPTIGFLVLNHDILTAFTSALDASLPSTRPAALDLVVQRELAYVRGLLDGGVIPLTIRDAFPDGDWDEAELVTQVLSKRLSPLADSIADALETWVLTAPSASPDDVTPVSAPPRASKPKAPAAEPAREHTPEPPEPSTPEANTPRPGPKRQAPRTMPDPEPPTQLEPIRQKKSGPSPAERTVRLKVLLSYSGELGVRIKKVPKSPSVAWMDKLQAKLEEIGAKKGIPSPFSFNGDDRHTEETMAFVLPADPEANAERQLRVDQMLAKAERAGLKLGSIPERPSESWLEDLEAKLDTAMAARRKERKERRERIAKQRQERIARMQAYATELSIDLGRIPPFPTEDWLARAERRIAAKMLPALEGNEDRGRAERLATLLARAADAELELEVPPDPDDVWLGWAESQVDRALGGGAALAIGEDPDEVHEPVPTLIFEEDTVQEQRWVIDADVFTIGRSRTNNVQVRHDGQLSREHCSIVRTEEGFTVEDLRSTQGTRLNEQPVRKPTVLTDGDIITIGETHLVFRLS